MTYKITYVDVDINNVAITTADGAGYVSDAINVTPPSATAQPLCTRWNGSLSGGVVAEIISRSSLYLTAPTSYTIQHGGTRQIRVFYYEP